MSAHSKRRRSAIVKKVETTPNLKQRRFTPQNKSVSIRKQQLSTPRTRQETLTQMGAIHYMPPSYDDGELELIDDYEQPPSSKRRKTKSEAVLKPARRERTAMKEDDANESVYQEAVIPADCRPRRKSRRLEDRRVTGNHIGQRQESSMVKSEPEAAGFNAMNMPDMRRTQPRSSKELMPPPRTPHSTRRKEVPSSQSPPDTPLSTQSRRSARKISRSPLNERSTNITLQLSSPSMSKTVRWPPLLEVADSMSSENGECRILAQVRGTSTAPVSRSAPNLVLRPVSDERSNEPFSRVLGGPEPNNYLATYQSREDSIPPNTKARNSQLVIRDSDGESEGDPYVVGLDIQPLHGGIVAISDSEVARGSPTVKCEQRSNGTRSTPSLLPPTPKSSFQVHQDDIHSIVENEQPTPTTRINQNEDSMRYEEPARSSPPQGNSTTSYRSPLQHQPPTSPSEEASLQFPGDLHRIISPLHILETEQQFENAWRSFTPPAILPNDLEKFNEGENAEHPESPDDLSRGFPDDFLDNLPLPIPNHHQAPIPSSQATTVDITQPSSHTRFRTQNALTQNLSSSPPRPSLFSSSPARTTKNGVENGTWDDIRLTDSQLLPESLMNDSLHAPPPYLLEDWVGDQLL